MASEASKSNVIMPRLPIASRGAAGCTGGSHGYSVVGRPAANFPTSVEFPARYISPQMKNVVCSFASDPRKQSTHSDRLLFNWKTETPGVEVKLIAA